MIPVSCVVPARYQSGRFPGKMLHPLLGIPLVVHTLRRAAEAECFEEILCLTDSPAIAAAVRDAGFRAELGGPADNGTDRIGKHLDRIRNQAIVNLQGDEPAFAPAALRLLAQALRSHPNEVHVLVHDEPVAEADAANPHRCKAGLDENGFIVDFYRRAPHRAVAASRLQMGAYGYGKTYLARYAALPPSGPELSESHELMRDLEMATVRAHACRFESQAVDIPQDAEKAAALLRRAFPGGVGALPASSESLTEAAEAASNMAIIAPIEFSRKV